MPGAGTDKTKRWIAEPAPVVILVEPQLGDNIGATARAMANFGLSRLRLVKPRDGWPNRRAWVAASGADRILDEAELFDTRRGGDRRSDLRARHDGAGARSGEAGGVAGRRRRDCWRRGSPPARASACCSGASATGSRTTRSRSPTAS